MAFNLNVVALRSLFYKEVVYNEIFFFMGFSDQNLVAIYWNPKFDSYFLHNQSFPGVFRVLNLNLQLKNHFK